MLHQVKLKGKQNVIDFDLVWARKTLAWKNIN